MSARRIIVGYDRSAGAKAAAAWALDEAARTGAPVEFFYAYQWPVWAPAASMVPAPAVQPDGEIQRAVQGALNEAVALARQTHPQVPTEISVEWTNAALALVDRSRDAALIVVGSQGHSGVAALLGSLSISVSAHAHCPVIVVKNHSDPAARIVAGVDDSPAAHEALAFAVAEATERGVPLTVFRAWPPVTGLWEGTPAVPGTVSAEGRRAFDELVAGWQAKHPELKITAQAVAEHPVAVLTRASADAQLIVVGSRGRGALRGMLLGSVSQNLLHRAACTVAVVHPTAN